MNEDERLLQEMFHLFFDRETSEELLRRYRAKPSHPRKYSIVGSFSNKDLSNFRKEQERLRRMRHNQDMKQCVCGHSPQSHSRQGVLKNCRHRTGSIPRCKCTQYQNKYGKELRYSKEGSQAYWVVL